MKKIYGHIMNNCAAMVSFAVLLCLAPKFSFLALPWIFIAIKRARSYVYHADQSIYICKDGAQRFSVGDHTRDEKLADYIVTYLAKREDDIGATARAMGNVRKYLQEKGEESTKIASGDLSFEVTLASEKDILGHAFKKMIGEFKHFVSMVQEAATQVDIESGQMSDSAQTLSQGATQTAASLEEITSTMNEIGAQTKKNAENSSVAKSLSDEAKESAEAGNDQMKKMIEAMNGINHSSEKISKIIKVIDEIAFQTNLLALNAAVEAARAGKHGKGFAVVAQEVRNLAARSAKAAKETTEMIEDSLKKVEAGNTITNDTAKSLESIMNGTTKVTDLINEISAASNEQAQSLSQVIVALSQIDQVTQKNTASAEESAATAVELVSQANKLKKLTDRFKLA